MSGLDLLVDGFPHGTVEGHARGCRGEICPSKREHGFSCAGAAIRYAGDFRFRARVDAGMSPAEIAELDRAEAEAVRAAEKAARAAERAARQGTRPKPVTVKRPAKPKAKPRKERKARRPWSDEEIARLRALHAQEMSDNQIGAELGRPQISVYKKRHDLGLKGWTRVWRHGTRLGYEHGCTEGCPASPSCAEVGRGYWRERSTERRRAAGVQPRYAS